MEEMEVRPYRPEDRAAIRAICADTGFLGKPIDPVFEDRELFADYLTGYYLDAEPESTFVTLLGGEVKGYMMGSRFPRKKARYEARKLPGLVLRGLWRYFTRPYNAASRRYVPLDSDQGAARGPFRPARYSAHPFQHPAGSAKRREHPRARRRLPGLSLRPRRKAGLRQVVSHGTRRGDRLFARYGFRLVDQREVTKYRELHPDKVHLLTVVKDLTENSQLYGLDLHKAPRS